MKSGIRLDQPHSDDPADNAEPCRICRQVFDRRDVVTVLWHAQREHGPLLDRASAITLFMGDEGPL